MEILFNGIQFAVAIAVGLVATVLGASEMTTFLQTEVRNSARLDPAAFIGGALLLLVGVGILLFCFVGALRWVLQ